MLRARNNWVIVTSLTQAKAQSTGIYIPETSYNVGLVYGVGPAVTDLKPGQKVYYGAQREQIRINDLDVLVMEESNVYAVETEPVNGKKEEAAEKA